MSQTAAPSNPRPAARRQTAPAQRRDPESRFHDVTASWCRLKNKDPSRRYIAPTKDQVPYYEELGYELELAREGGIVPFGKSEPGSVIERRGHVFMSIPNERWEELQRRGDDGVSGQELHDKIEDRMIKNRGQRDPLRGHRGQIYLVTEDETGAAQAE